MARKATIQLISYAIELAGVSAAYLSAFYLTFDVWQPLQARIVPGLGEASLLFLPHGIRVVVA